MIAYRAVFCDIDGTLLDSRHRLAPDTVAGVRRVADAGIPFILVSARAPAAMRPVQAAIGAGGPMAAYGGALMLDAGRNPAHSLGLAPELTKDIKRRAAIGWPSVAVTVYSYDDWLVDDPTDPRIVREVEITGMPTSSLAFDAALSGGREAHKVFCVGDPDRILDMERGMIRSYPGLSIHKSSPHFLEIMNGAATKANAVRFLCHALRIPLAETVCFGDSYNDIDMLEAAGLGVAMGNAPEAVRKRAALVAPDNDSAGVARILETLSFRPLPHDAPSERAASGDIFG